MWGPVLRHQSGVWPEGATEVPSLHPITISKFGTFSLMIPALQLLV